MKIGQMTEKYKVPIAYFSFSAQVNATVYFAHKYYTKFVKRALNHWKESFPLLFHPKGTE